VDVPETNPRISRPTRRRLLGGLAGLAGAARLGWWDRIAAQSATPSPEASNTGDGSAEAPFQLVILSDLEEIDTNLLSDLAEVLNKQISNDFAPAWNIHAIVKPYPKKNEDGSWRLAY